MTGVQVHDRLGRPGTKCRVEGGYGGVHGGRQQAIVAATPQEGRDG
jgi:hypothetical protein